MPVSQFSHKQEVPPFWSHEEVLLTASKTRACPCNSPFFMEESPSLTHLVLHISSDYCFFVSKKIWVVEVTQTHRLHISHVIDFVHHPSSSMLPIVPYCSGLDKVGGSPSCVRSLVLTGTVLEVMTRHELGLNTVISFLGAPHVCPVNAHKTSYVRE